MLSTGTQICWAGGPRSKIADTNHERRQGNERSGPLGTFSGTLATCRVAHVPNIVASRRNEISSWAQMYASGLAELL